MMSSTFSPSSYLSFSLPPAAAHCDHSSVPFLLYSSGMDPLKGPGPPLLPYLSPFHHHGHFSVYECPFEPAFIQKRNERERQRVRCVNQGYAKLREHLPGQSADKRLSKVETLRAAIRYIKYLQGLVETDDVGLNSPPGPDCGRQPEGQTRPTSCWTGTEKELRDENL